MRHNEVYACRTGRPPAEVVQVDDEEDPDTKKARETADYSFQAAAVVEAKEATQEERIAQKGVDVTEAMRVKVNSTLDACVEVVDISITDVELPPNIAQQMTARTLVKSKQMYEALGRRGNYFEGWDGVEQ